MPDCPKEVRKSIRPEAVRRMPAQKVRVRIVGIERFVTQNKN
jgi:hypothetical protein